MSDDAILQATGLKKSYGKRTAVDGIDIAVRPGEVFGLLGPNGAGKTTAISMMTGFVKPNAGTVSVDGLDMTKNGAAAKELLGVVPQEIAVYPTLSARQNLRFFASAQRVPRADVDAAVDWALEVVGLQDRAKDRISSFSGGMQRRVNIACGIVHRPCVLFLDEPTVGVDAQSRERIFETVELLKRELQMAVVYTSHYMPEVERLCDRMAIIDSGKIIAEGTLDTLLSSMPHGQIVWEIDHSTLPADGWTPRQAAEWLSRVGDVELHPGETMSKIVLAGPDQALCLRAIAKLSEHTQIDLGGLTIQTASLETLFLNLTGRDIRDGAA